MNQNIVKYLQENKEQYSQESLVAQLKESGYDVTEINEGVGFVYNSNPNIEVESKNKFKLIGIGCGIMALLIIMVVGGIVFYLYGMGKDALEPYDAGYQQNENMSEYGTDVGVKKNMSSDSENIVINDIHFVLDNVGALITGDAQYTYLPIDEALDQQFDIIISDRVPYDSEGMRDFYKNISENGMQSAVNGEWSDEDNDEFGFYVSLYDEDADETEYVLADITNNGLFYSTLAAIIDGEVEQNEMKKIIADFRQVSMNESVAFEINDTTSQRSVDSASNIAFNFNKEDFIFDITSVFEYSSDEYKRYVLASEEQKHEKTEYMLISKLEEVVYDSAEDGCEDMTSQIDSAFKVTDISFESDGECGFILSGIDKGDFFYEWHKVIDGGMQAYQYIMVKSIDGELSAKTINGITNEFKAFNY